VCILSLLPQLAAQKKRIQREVEVSASLKGKFLKGLLPPTIRLTTRAARQCQCQKEKKNSTLCNRLSRRAQVGTIHTNKRRSES
jgi:hypothetical protein